MKALVTGARGLIGANLVRALLKNGDGVRAMLRTTSDLGTLGGLPTEIVRGDVFDPDSLVAAAEGCDVVFHTATYFAYTGHDPEHLEATAVEGTRNVLVAAKQAGVRRVVMTSSSVVLGWSEQPVVLDEDANLADPKDESPYVAAKIRQDETAVTLAERLGIELVIVCPTMSIGPYGSTLGPSNAVVVAYLANPLRMTFPGGCNIVSVRDVADGHVLAAEAGVPGERYILGSENLEWSAIHAIVADLCGVPAPLATGTRAQCYAAAAIEELRARLERRPPMGTRFEAKMLGRYYWYSHDKLARLGFAPMPAAAALAEAVSWLAPSPHVSRETRIGMHLSREVYDARRILAEQENKLRESR